jgi:hypothetical protein
MNFRFHGCRHAVFVDSRGALQHFNELHPDQNDWVGEVIYRNCDPKRGHEVSVTADSGGITITAPLKNDAGLVLAEAGAGWIITELANHP